MHKHASSPIPPALKRRLRQNPPHKDGTPGCYYLRLRLEARDPRMKSITLDLPLETPLPHLAAERAGFALRTLQRAGARVLGNISDILTLTSAPHRRRTKRPRKKTPHYTQLRLPGL